MRSHPGMIVDKFRAGEAIEGFDPGSGRSSPCLLGLALAILLATGACRPAQPVPEGMEDGRLVLDLIAELDAAGVELESAVIDPGRPSDRRHLLSGWSAGEQDAAGDFAWGLGEAAALSFFAVAPAGVTLGLQCQPLVFEGGPDQIVSVAANGRALGEIRFGQPLERHEIEIPAAAVVPGWNRLDFRFATSHRPRDVIAGAEDQRELALRCYEIELEGLGADGSPALARPGAGTETDTGEARPDRIELPAGTSVTYYFDHTADSELVIGALETWGPSAGDVKLLVRFRSAGDAAETLRFIESGDDSPPLRLPLATGGPGIDRLELAAVSEPRRRGGPRQWLGLARKASGLSLVLPSVRDPGAPDARDRDPVPDSDPPDGAPVPASGTTDPLPSPRPNVILYLIDTLRADHLGAYGYGRPTSPNIDRFAADAVLFENARAQSSWTRPAVASLLTGLRPRAHGVNRRRDALSSSFDTLPELLARQGYDTAAFVTNGNAGPDFGLDQGFDHFRYLRESGETAERHQLSDSLNQWLFRWLEDRDPNGGPFFLFAHATDPHAPYTPREPFRRRFAPDVDPEIGRLANVQALISGRREATADTREDLIDLYDGEIAFNDHHFGQLLDRLKELGLYESSLILLLSDHGEEFLEHGWWEHGVTLYGEQLDVPMILKLPANRDAGKRIAATVSQVDVLPAILDLLGLDPPAAVAAGGLLDAAERDPSPSFAYLALQDRLIRSVTWNSWKLILDDSHYPRGQPVQLYQAGRDPGETAELAADRPFERELLAQMLRRWEVDLARGLGATGEQAEIPDELRRQLEALGYL